MNFIKYYVNFNNPKMMTTFTKEVEQLLGRTTPMGTEEYLLDRFKREGIAEGIQAGEAKGRHEEAVEIARNFKSMGVVIADIAKGTGLTIEEIEAL